MWRPKEQVFSKEFLSSVLSGHSEFIEDGYVKFDQIQFSAKNDDVEINFYFQGHYLGTIYSDNGWCPGNIYSFYIGRGMMGVKFDETACAKKRVESFDEWLW